MATHRAYRVFSALFLAVLFIFTVRCSGLAINTEPQVALSDSTATYAVHDGLSANLVPSQQQLDAFITGPKLTLGLHREWYIAAEDPALQPGVLLLVLSYLLTEEAAVTRESISEIYVDGQGVGSVVWELLARVIERIPVLTSVEWAVQGPTAPEVFTALKASHPKAILYFSISSGAIPSCHPLPHFMTVNARYGCSPSHDTAEVLPSSLKLLQTCPSVKGLELTMERCGCVLSLGDHFAFDLSDATKWVANLTSLTVYGYDFDEDPRPESYRYGEPWTLRGLGMLFKNLLEDLGKGVDSVALWIVCTFNLWWTVGIFDGIRDWMSGQARIDGPRVTNLDRWMEVMDWSNMGQLRIKNSPVKQLAKLGGALPRLTEFELERNLYGMWWDRHVEERPAVLEFLSIVPPLKKLALSGMGGSMPLKEMLRRHGESLESLKLHEKEVHYDPTFCKTRERDTLSVRELEMIRNMCPKLERLEVDVDRNGTWSSDILTTLATFPAVSHLTLNLQLGILNETYTLPRLDNTTALHIFNYLRTRKLGVELKSVKIVLGEWGEHHSRGLRYPGWDEDRRGFYECEFKDAEETCLIGGADQCFEWENRKLWPCDEGGKYGNQRGGVLRDEL